LNVDERGELLGSLDPMINFDYPTIGKLKVITPELFTHF
jgi:hypothetical protein